MTGKLFAGKKLARIVCAAATTVVAALGVIAGAGAVAAQNYPGDGRLRFGTFFQLHGAPAEETLPRANTGDVSGFGVGVTFGYDWNLYKNWIVGVEADGTATDAGGNLGSGTYNSDYMATFRGRIGYQYNPKLLLYGTTGVAFNGVHFKGPATAAQQALNPGTNFKISTTLPGFVGGLGAEYEWNGMHLFAEYLYAGFDNWAFAGGIDGRHSFDTDTHMFRLGVKFLYGHDHMYEDNRRPSRRY
jgi:opacity protein-like surface antigen